MKSTTSTFITFALLAAISYAIMAAVFLFNTTYSNTWLLYLGNILFTVFVMYGIIQANHRVQDGASIKSMFTIGLQITLYALIIASVACLIMLGIKSVMSNSYDAVPNSPDNAGIDTRGDLVLTLFMSVVVVNAILGGLAALVGSSVAKRNQKTERGKSLH